MIEFSKLDSHEKRIVWNLAETVGTITPYLFASVNHIGELWAASAFLSMTPNVDDDGYKRVCIALKRGHKNGESVLEIINAIHPNFEPFEASFDGELVDLLPQLEIAPEAH